MIVHQQIKCEHYHHRLYTRLMLEEAEMKHYEDGQAPNTSEASQDSKSHLALFEAALNATEAMDAVEL